ncbi:CAP domain-containing protein [Deinococcus sp.]|uniref:CAP domain-containing protein n=1 Tax=Deinococcus sp. TaxID=47478 RepID=UPI003CC56F2C
MSSLCLRSGTRRIASLLRPTGLLLGCALALPACAPRPAGGTDSPKAQAAAAQESQAQPRLSLVADAKRQAPLDVAFQSGLPTGASVQWQFGDGAVGSGSAARHTYYAPGHYEVAVSMSVAGRQYNSTIPLDVRSSGPEQAAAVLLLDDAGASLALGTQGSVVYAPFTPRFWLDGQAVSGLRQPIAAGAHTVQVQMLGKGGPLERSYRFTSSPLTRRPDYDAQVLTLTNQARQDGWDCARKAYGGPPRPPLTFSAQLAAAARAQSSAMALGGYFDHRSALDGSLPDDRIRASGYLPLQDGENIAAGQLTPQEVVTAWLKSPGHCVNIMGDYSEIGVAYVHLDGSASRDYWTQTFGTPAEHL